MNTQLSHLYSIETDDDKSRLDDGVIETIVHKSEEEESQQLIEEAASEMENMRSGERLRFIREQKNLSITYVAEKLYLDQGVVQALEEEDYERLPPAIFVRGYLRNYAKLLDIPPESVLGSYNEIARENPPMLTAKIQQRNQASIADWWMQGITYTILITLMLLMVLWGVHNYSSISNNAPSTQPVASMDNNEAGGFRLPIPNANSQGNEGETSYTPPSESSEETDNGGIQIAIPLSPGMSDPNENTTALPAQNLPTANQTPRAEPEEKTPPKPTFTNEQLHTLVINYEKDSWTRVIDETGEKVYEGIPKGGEQITVTGEPPFKIRLGVIEGVSVQYKDKIINVKNHPSRDGRTISVGTKLPE